MIERIAELVRDKRIEGISDIRDESDRHGMRVVIELKRDAMADVVLNQLYRFSPLQTTFGVNMVALTGGRPEMLNLKDMLQAFIAFREEVVTRRTKFLLNKARERAHILVGLAIAVANIDEVIRLIRSAPDPAEAREELMARDWPAERHGAADRADRRSRGTASTEDGTFRLSEDQARAILELRLQRLTALGRDEIARRDGEARPRRSRTISPSCARARGCWTSSRTELAAVKAEFATPRRTEIVDRKARSRTRT